MKDVARDAADTLILQEKITYTFQQTQVARRTSWSNAGLQDLASTASSPTDNVAPDVIILSLWPQATPEQKAYYTSGYRTLYPKARISSLHNNTAKFKDDDKDYEAALDELTRNDSEGKPLGSHPTVLLHLFGSGAVGACKVLHGYRARTGRPMDIKVVIADTEPLPSITTAFTASQPLSSAFFNFLLALWIRLQAYIYLLSPDFNADQIHHDLQNPGLLPAEARKCFIFAHRGFMLRWLRHGSTSQPFPNAGAADVGADEYERREYAFERHSIDRIGKWTGDQERYWLGIQDVWEGR